MVRVRFTRYNPYYIGQLASADIGQHLRRRVDVIGDIARTCALKHALDYVWLANVSNGNRRVPTGRRTVILPRQSSVIEQVGERAVFETWISRAVFFAERADQGNKAVRWCSATPADGRDFGSEVSAVRRRSRRPTNDELMGRKAWPFIRLEHAVRPAVAPSDIKVRLDCPG